MLLDSLLLFSLTLAKKASGIRKSHDRGLGKECLYLTDLSFRDDNLPVLLIEFLTVVVKMQWLLIVRLGGLELSEEFLK